MRRSPWPEARPVERRAGFHAVVVGAGFSGTATAVELLRQAGTAGDVRVTVLERTGRFGRGVAYGTARPEHLLNVTVGRMSALEDEPGHFLAWARDRGLAISADDFVSRGVYGAYLEDLLADAAREAPTGSLELVADEAVAVEDGAASARVRTRAGRR